MVSLMFPVAREQQSFMCLFQNKATFTFTALYLKIDAEHTCPKTKEL